MGSYIFIVGTLFCTLVLNNTIKPGYRFGSGGAVNKGRDLLLGGNGSCTDYAIKFGHDWTCIPTMSVWERDGKNVIVYNCVSFCGVYVGSNLHPATVANKGLQGFPPKYMKIPSGDDCILGGG